MNLLEASRGKDCGYTRETRARGTEISSIRKIARNGRAIEAEDGGSDAGEEAQPGTQGNHIMSHHRLSLFLFLCTLMFPRYDMICV